MADAMESRLQEIERSAGELEGKLRAQVARVERSKRITLVTGIIVIVIIFGYLTFLTVMLKPYANATFVADQIKLRANEYAQVQVPEIAKALKESAPDVIKSLREQAMTGVPMLRERAEEETMALVDRFTTKMETTVDGIVSEMIKQHKGELEPLIEAASVKGNDVEIEKAFQESLEELIGPEMDKLFAKFNQDMDAVQQMLAYYSQPDDKLTSAELANKYLIIAVLGFINEAANSQLLTPPAPPKAM